MEGTIHVIWNWIVAVDLLMKKLLETRPYEKEKGKTDQVYQEVVGIPVSELLDSIVGEQLIHAGK